MRFRGTSFEFDSATGEVRRDNVVHRLEPQPAALLALLMSRPGELVSRQEAIHALWGDHTCVSFAEGLNYSIRQIRVALGDQARHPRFVETIPHRGYRYLASTPPAPPAVDQAAFLINPARMAALMAVLVLLAAALVAVERRPNRHHEIAVAILKSVHDRLF